MTSLRKSRATGGEAPLRRTAEAHLFLRVRDSRGVSGGIGDRWQPCTFFWRTTVTN